MPQIQKSSNEIEEQPFGQTSFKNHIFKKYIHYNNGNYLVESNTSIRNIGNPSLELVKVNVLISLM